MSSRTKEYSLAVGPVGSKTIFLVNRTVGNILIVGQWVAEQKYISASWQQNKITVW